MRSRRSYPEDLEVRRCLAVDFSFHELGGTINTYTDTMRVADFDGDGDQDFVFAQNQGGDGILSWYENLDGKGTFDEVEGIAIGPVTWVEVVDMDGDGDIDVVSAAYDVQLAKSEPGKIVWYENTGGAFGAEQVITDQLLAPYFDVADMDGDGDVDVVAGSFGRITWHENRDGTFLSETVTPIEDMFSYAVAAADLDGDGDNDILWSSYGDNRVGWSENLDGKGLFSEDRVLLTNATSVGDLATFDADADGNLDVLVPDTSDLTLLTNSDGSGTFATTTLDIGEHFVVSPVDLDGDGDLDIVTDRNDSIAWFENHADGTFSRAKTIAELNDQGLLGVVPADLDGDGDQDLLANVAVFDQRGGRIIWYENQTIHNRLAGDVNGDGRFDSSDLVQAMAAGEYEDRVRDNSSFDEGDWNGDGDFDTADLVFAFQQSQYEPPTPAQRR